MTRLGIAIPKDWAICKLGEIIEIVRGASPRPKGDPRYFGGDIPWISIRDVTKEPSRYLKSTAEGVTSAGAEKSRLLPVGTLILSNSATVCVPKILAIAGCIHDGFVAFPKLPSDLDQLYLFEFFNMIRSEVLNEHRQGATQVNLNTDIVRNFELPIAPLHEQHRIAEAIESYFPRLDDAVATLSRVERNLKRYRASVLKSAVEGRLVPTEAALAKHEGRDYEPASVLLDRILTERRRRWTESGKKGKYEEPAPPDTTGLPELPEGWCWATIDMIAEVQGGLTKGQKRKSDTELREVPYLRVANVQRGFLDLSEIKTISATEDEIVELRLEPGDILFNEGGDRDKLGRGWIWSGELPECVHQNHVFRARVLTDDIQPRYLSWYGNGSGQAYFFDQGKQTTNLASINLTKLKGLPVPIPPKQEQARIVEEVDRLLSVTDESLTEVERNSVRCQRLRQSILKWAFEGKLADQDPSDEPASVLLERIKAERDIPKSAKKKSRA